MLNLGGLIPIPIPIHNAPAQRSHRRRPADAHVELLRMKLADGVPGKLRRACMSVAARLAVRHPVVFLTRHGGKDSIAPAGKFADFFVRSSLKRRDMRITIELKEAQHRQLLAIN